MHLPYTLHSATVVRIQGANVGSTQVLTRCFLEDGITIGSAQCELDCTRHLFLRPTVSENGSGELLRRLQNYSLQLKDRGKGRKRL